MPQFERIYQEFAELDPIERELFVGQILVSGLAPLHPGALEWVQRYYTPEYPSIVATPGICGGAARLIRTRIPVWSLERMRQLNVSESDILRCYPTLRAVDLVQAWAYVARHPEEIEKAIRENEEEDNGS